MYNNLVEGLAALKRKYLKKKREKNKDSALSRLTYDMKSPRAMAAATSESPHNIFLKRN